MWSVRLVLLVSCAPARALRPGHSTRQNRAAPSHYARLGASQRHCPREPRVGGVVLLAFIIFHLLHFTTGTLHPQFDAHDAYGNVIIGFGVPVVVFYLVAMVAWPCTTHPGSGRVPDAGLESSPSIAPGAEWRRWRSTVPAAFSAIVLAAALKDGSHDRPRYPGAERARFPRARWRTSGTSIVSTSKLVNPPTGAASDPGGRIRPRRRASAATLGELGYGWSASPSMIRRGAGITRAGRDQRREELPERRRQHLPAVLRHGEGRRLPGPQGERVPPGPDQRRDHRSVRGAGVPFARGVGLLANRSFGGAQVSRTFYARGQTGQRTPCSGAYSAGRRWRGTVTVVPRAEMLDLVVINGRARGIVTRDLVSGAVRSWAGDAVVLATGGYGNVFYSPPTRRRATSPRPTARGSGAPRSPTRATPRFIRPAFPTAVTTSRSSPSCPRRCGTTAGCGCRCTRETGARRATFPKRSGTTTWSGSTPASGTWRRGTLRRGRRSRYATRGRGVEDRTRRLPRFRRRDPAGGRTGGAGTVRQSLRDVRADHRREPVPGADADLPAVHYTMGGLWVDYNLMSTSPAACAGRGQFLRITAPTGWSASALMQGPRGRLLHHSGDAR